ncbi:hypothetical protein GCM10009626_39320 [Brachybacterium sacelli]
MRAAADDARGVRAAADDARGVRAAADDARGVRAAADDERGSSPVQAPVASAVSMSAAISPGSTSEA